jgi:hypothetical protein
MNINAKVYRDECEASEVSNKCIHCSSRLIPMRSIYRVVRRLTYIVQKPITVSRIKLSIRSWGYYTHS